jgi:carboxyl-terminal processing protease
MEKKDLIPMKKMCIRWTAAGLALTAMLLAAFVPGFLRSARADDAAVQSQTAPQAVADVENQAFKAIRAGQFDLGNSLLDRAASQSGDPKLLQMHRWTSAFDTQLKTFADERHNAYTKAVGDVQLLLKNGHEDYALGFATRAQVLSDDKLAFHDLPWVQSLIANSIKKAADYEAAGRWPEAWNLYADLASIEPASKEWKDKLNDVTRRVQLLGMFVPDDLKAIQDKQNKERDEVAALVQPTTKPTASATTQPDDLATNDDFRIDWHDTLSDIHMPMLQSAMYDACQNYYRDVTYKGLLIGGLQGLEAVMTTQGLEKTFPGLADKAKHDAFQKYLDQCLATANASVSPNDEILLDDLLSDSKDGLLATDADTVGLPEEVIVYEFANGALAGLDPFTDVIWPSELPDFVKMTQGTFSGVGIWIDSNNDGNLRVVSPLEDSPAYKAGIKADDVIARINGKNAKGITLNQAVKTITGPAGTTVLLGIRSPDNQFKNYTIRRETIKVSSVKGYLRKPSGGWDYYVDPENKIAYLRITNFTDTSAAELSKAIDDMGDNINGMILDLRDNPGGLLVAAIDVCDKFLDGGVIVSTRPDRVTQNDPTINSAKPDRNEFRKPLVVLVNQYSASASEIVSGALHDDHRAILVGERTFGKGSVQMTFPLSDGSARLKLTTSHYYLPSGRCIHREENSTTWGVDPDVEVQMTPEQINNVFIARRNLDVLRDASATTQPADSKVAAAPATQPADLLTVDPQLSAAVLVLRLEIAGATL